MTSSTAPTSASPRATFVCEGPLVIGTVADWQRRLSEYVTGTAPLQLDLGAVTALDAFGLQLLVAAQRSARSRGQALHFTKFPEGFAEACDAVGVSPATFSVSPS